MHVSPVMLGLAALVVIIAFGPKRLPSFKRDPNANQVDFTSMLPSQPAAGRAPSPLANESVAPPVAQPEPQYAFTAPAPIPVQGQPAPLRLPDNL